MCQVQKNVHTPNAYQVAHGSRKSRFQQKSTRRKRKMVQGETKDE